MGGTNLVACDPFRHFFAEMPRDTIGHEVAY